MPEAAVDEDDRFTGTEDEVGRARQALVVQAIAVSHRMNEASYVHLRQSVFAADAAHIFRAALLIETVHLLCDARMTLCPCYLFAMEEAELTRLGFRKELDKEHRDFDLLTRLEEAIIGHAKGWERFVVVVFNL